METVFKVGDRVRFGRVFSKTTMGMTLGEVIKVNPTKLKVRTLEARGRHAAGTIWTVPKSMCSVDSLLPRQPAPRRPETEIFDEIRSLYRKLSSESLAADCNKVPQWVIARRTSTFRKRLQECFAELGRKITEAEAFALPAPAPPQPERQREPVNQSQPDQTFHDAVAALMRQF